MKRIDRLHAWIELDYPARLILVMLVVCFAIMSIGECAQNQNIQHRLDHLEARPR